MPGRLLVAVVGLLELLATRRFVDFWMRTAAKGDDPVELEDWAYTVARLEGAVLVLWAVSGWRSGRRTGETA